MVVVRSATVSTLIEGGTEASACGSKARTRCHGIDDIGPRLFEDQQYDAVAAVLPRGHQPCFPGRRPQRRCRECAPRAPFLYATTTSFQGAAFSS